MKVTESHYCMDRVERDIGKLGQALKELMEILNLLCEDLKQSHKSRRLRIFQIQFVISLIK